MRLPRRRLLLGLGVLLAALFALKLAVDDAFLGYILAFIGWGGVPAFFVFSVLYNVWIIPFPYDVFLAATPWLYPGQAGAVLVASIVAMPIAAALAYFAGRQLTQHARRWFRHVKSFPRALRFLEKYGAYAIAFSAITPLPFSVVSWACGMARTPLWPFLITALVTRGLRNAVVWWMVQ